MPYLRFANFKTGSTPSKLQKFDMNNLTGSQKLDLIKTRIFGTMIGDERRTGLQFIKKQMRGKRRAQYYELTDLRKEFPWHVDSEKELYDWSKFQRRKLRTLMRGIKVGKGKGGMKSDAIAMFDTGPKHTRERDDNLEVGDQQGDEKGENDHFGI